MGTNTNRKNGLRFEAELCEKLAENGWWAHDMTQAAAGQPADIIAVRNNHAVLIDCKVCATDRFALSRIEPNQVSAMTLWEKRGNEDAYFAVKYPNEVIYMIHFNRMISSGNVNIPEWYAHSQGFYFDEWIEMMKDEIG